MKRTKHWAWMCAIGFACVASMAGAQDDDLVDLEALLGGGDSGNGAENLTSDDADGAMDDLEALLGGEPSSGGAEEASAEDMDRDRAADPQEDDADLVSPEDRALDAEMVSKQNEIREQAAKREGLTALDNGYHAMEEGQWAKAVGLFEVSLSKLKPVPMLMPYIDGARQQSAEAYYQMAKSLYERREDVEDMSSAKNYINSARTVYQDSEELADLEKSIAKYEMKVAKHGIQKDIRDEDKYKNRDQAIKSLLSRGRKELKVRDYDAAEQTFEEVLAYDRYNRDALRFLGKVAEEKLEARSIERETSSTEQMLALEERWALPRAVDTRGLGAKLVVDGPTTVDDPNENMDRRLNDIRIPQISFRRANIGDVIQYLIEASREADDEGIGVNIIFMDPEIAADASGAASAMGADPSVDDLFSADFGAPAAAATPSAGVITPISLELTNVTMLDALKWVTQIADLYYRYERNVVIIERKGSGPKITRFYPVDATRFTHLTSTMPQGGGGGGGGAVDPFADPFGGGGGGGGAAASGGSDIQTLFERYGVEFPPQTSVTYDAAISQLIVTHSPDAFPKFEQVLKKINVQPVQVEIEARFVEVQQGDMEELGVEWILGDNWELAVKDGPGPVSSRPRVQVDAGDLTNPLLWFGNDGQSENPTIGNRASAANGLIGEFLSISGVLTNPELQAVVHAIDQQGKSDLLSAPRVTTINGVNAIIEVVEELIYPTEFDVTENDINVQNSGGIGGGGNSVFIPPTVIPGSFETREVGVILNVTPTVSTDNYTINLTLLPEIVELVDWIQYGTQIPTGAGTLPVLINMPQPIFASRNVTTSMIVWDGHTVVMGGLIREDMVSFESKIPILGDIPLLGKLFRSQGKRSTKRNLLIFVTATLVDPSGEPVAVDRDLQMGSGSAAPSSSNSGPIDVAF